MFGTLDSFAFPWRCLKILILKNEIKQNFRFRQFYIFRNLTLTYCIKKIILPTTFQQNLKLCNFVLNIFSLRNRSKKLEKVRIFVMIIFGYYNLSKIDDLWYFIQLLGLYFHYIDWTVWKIAYQLLHLIHVKNWTQKLIIYYNNVLLCPILKYEKSYSLSSTNMNHNIWFIQLSENSYYKNPFFVTV